ncbi:MAG TPA: methyltransferase domain-containing protein [Alphaproteobacteria bacterium]|nr:methyltransferase domain-containing protein [Alphaproteobacteria bacterium]
MTETAMAVFDRRLVRRRRERAAARLEQHDFLFREVAERLVDRLGDTKRRFSLALELGRRGPALGRLALGKSGIERLVALAPAHGLVRDADATAVVADEEALPFADSSFDLILSSLALHWVNDLPGALIQACRALKPDGLFLAALFGGETLRELRAALLEAEIEVEGGAGPRVSPFADVRDAGSLLQRAGLALPVVDRDAITVTYPDALALMRDLRGMGETNAVAAQRRSFSRRATLLRAAAIYEERFAGPDGRVPATFEVIYLTGWAPHGSQQKALKPGSAAARLAAALDSEERPAGDKVPRGVR